MAVSVTIVEEKFFAELNNGSTFSLATTDFATHLKGGVLEKIKATFTVQVFWTSLLTNFWVNYDGATLLTLQDNGVSFVSDGFAVGDSIKISIPSGAGGIGADAKITGTVASISGGTISLNSVSIASGTIPTGITNFPYSSTHGSSYVTGLTSLTSLRYKFGLIENNEPFNTLSKLTNSDQIYLASSINHGSPGTFSTGVSFGTNKAWQTGSFKVAFSQLVLDQDLIFNESTTQEFDIEHIFVINPIYRDGELSSLNGSSIPPVDIFNGSKSLKYVFEAEFRTVINNPNTSKIGEYDSSWGSVGYLDESFNGFPNDYSISGLTYTDVFTSQTLTAIDVNTTTRVNFNITGTGLMAAGVRVVVGHTAILDSLQYASSAEDYNTLWVNETLRNTVGASLVNGSVIKGLTITLTSVDVIAVQFSVVFNNSQKYKLANNQNYLLYCTIQDGSASVDAGNKVTLRVAQSQYIKSVDVSGLLTANTFQQYPHPEPYTQGVTTGYRQGKMFVEDGQMAYADLRLTSFYVSGNPEDPSTQVTHAVNLRSLKFQIVAFDTVNETWFVIRTLDIDLSSGVVLAGTPPITYTYYNLDSTRGYILQNTDIFNYLKFKTGSLIGDDMQYHLEVGYKIPWQEWLALVGADTVFYDVSEENNGLNNNTSNYAFTHNYKIRFFLNAEVDTAGITTNYVLSSGDFEAYDYMTDDAGGAFSCSIQTYDIDDNPLANNIIDQSYTRIEATFTPTGGGELFPADYYGIIRIEPINATSDAAISELSTMIEAPTNSLLKQISGSSRLATLTTGGGAYIVKGLVDTSLTSMGVQYKISAELRKKDLEL